jgi:hypothetical protein
VLELYVVHVPRVLLSGGFDPDPDPDPRDRRRKKERKKEKM